MSVQKIENISITGEIFFLVTKTIFIYFPFIFLIPNISWSMNKKSYIIREYKHCFNIQFFKFFLFQL